MVLEKKELPTKQNEDIQVCEVCGAILLTTQERASRRCIRCMSSQQT